MAQSIYNLKALTGDDWAKKMWPIRDLDLPFTVFTVHDRAMEGFQL